MHRSLHFMKKYWPVVSCVLLIVWCGSARAATKWVPVSAFKNLCALKTEKIEDFLICTQAILTEEDKYYIADNFHDQVKQMGALTRSEVVKVVCRSVADDGSVIIGEYLDGVGDDSAYVATVLRRCGFTG